MASASAPASARRSLPGARRTPGRTLRPGDAAWVAALPCALVTVVLVVVLGPAVGHALLAPAPDRFWPGTGARPQPVEHGRFVVGLLAAPLLVGALLASRRVPLRLSARAVRGLVLTGQAALLAFLALCLAAQNDVGLSADFPLEPHTAYFTPATLAVAAALALLAPAVLRDARVRRALGRLGASTPRLRAACTAVAALATIAWLLTAVNLDSSIGTTNEAVMRHLQATLDEPFAILDGRTPLVNFHAQYGQLWPYVAALPMALLGATLATYTVTMATISALVMLALHAVLRRVARSPLAGLALFLPVLASSFFMEIGPPANRYGPANLYMVWPVRFAGPYLLAWLLARHLDRARPRGTLPLFLAAGLVVVNNPEFGVAALAATVAALVCVRPPRSGRAAGALLGQLLLGLLGAVALVSLLTLVGAGALPRFGLLTEFARIYGLDGWAALPMPVLGLHVAVFLTFAAAGTVAVVQRARRAHDELLTGLLAWIAAFGLLSAGYYVGRAHPGALFDLFSPWSLALALLLLACGRELAARDWRRPGGPELAVLFGFALAACSLAQLPTPWSQLARLRDRAPTQVLRQPEATRLVAATSERGERVAILIPLSHRIAYEAGVTNVAPYSSLESMPTREQLDSLIRQLREERVRKLYLSSSDALPPVQQALAHAGFVAGRSEGSYVELTRI